MRRPARELRSHIKREANESGKKADLSDQTVEALEERVRIGNVVARLMDSEDWTVIEDIIMKEGRADSMVALAMKEEVTEEDLRQQHVNVVRFGVATRIINRFHLAVELGDKADLSLRRRTAALENQPEKKVRPQSERRGKSSPR